MPLVTGVTPVAPPDATAALARLVALVDGAERAPDRDHTVGEIAAVLGDGEALRGLAAAHRADPAPIAALLMRLGAFPGVKQRTARLERAIRDEAKRQVSAEKVVRREAAVARAAGGPIAEALAPVLAGHELVPGLVCPGGWELTTSGVYRLKVNTDTGDTSAVDVSHRPILVEGRFRDIHDNTVTLALGWPTAAHRWQLQPAPRLKVADSRQLVTLAAHDAPVTSNNASELVAFLDDFEAANAATIPEVRVSSRMGWQGSGADRCFLWGRNQVRRGGVLTAPPVEGEAPAKWARGQIHLLVTDDGIRGLCEGFRAAGTWEGWVEAVRLATPYPAVFVGLYASLVPPLMAVLPALANFIVDFCGETSKGKTTTMRLAASAWGSPEERGTGIIYTWDATRVFIERAAALTDYHPLFLDDTKRARRPDDVGKTLYDYASGVGRGRGSPQGIQRTTRAHGVLISTGEAPATSFTNDGGTRARTLCLWGSPFGGATPATEIAVRGINAGVLGHYGHAGPMVVRWLLDVAEAPDLARGEFEAQLVAWTKLANGNPVASRAAAYIAAMAVARRVLHEVLAVPVPEADPLALAWEAVIKSSAESDRASDALRDVLSWATGQQHRFWGRLEGDTTEDDQPGAGWLGAWSRQPTWSYLALLPTELRGFLEKQKYDAEAVLRAWDDRGWLVREVEHRTSKVTVGAVKPRCYVIKRSAADFVAGDSHA
jgi:putative DNA primase/helicase